MKTTLLVFSVLTLAVGFSHAQAGVVFSDGEFYLSDWSQEKIYDNTPGQAASFWVARVETSGNPGAYRHTFHSWCGDGAPDSSRGMVIAHLRLGATFDPEEGDTLISVDVAFDAIFWEYVDPRAVGIGPLILQAGYYYWVTGVVTQQEWTHFELPGLTAQDFRLIMGQIGPAHPDFSGTGEPIQFGYYTSNGTMGAICLTTDSGIDNWTLELNASTSGCEPPSQPFDLGGAVKVCHHGRPTQWVRVHYELAEQSQISAKIYNVSGALVTVLGKRVQAAGCHQLDWDLRDQTGRRVSPGVYVLQLQTPDGAHCEKIAVVR